MSTASRPSSMLGAPGRLLSRLAGMLREERDAADIEPGAPLVEMDVVDETADSGSASNMQALDLPEPNLVELADTDIATLDRHHREMLGLVEGIADRLDTTGDHTRLLVDEIAGIPGSMAPLSSIGRAQAVLLESIRDEAARTSGGVEAIGASLREDRKRLAAHDDLIDRVTDTLRETTTVSSHTHEALASLQTTAEQLSATTGRLANALQKASERASTREDRMVKALDRTHRWTVAAVGICGAIATLALIGIIWVLAT